MRKKTLLIIALLTVGNLFAQNSKLNDYSVKTKRGTYLGITTGINNPGGGLGIRLNTNITNSTMLDFAAGRGTWGYKFSSNIILKTDKPKGIMPFVGFSYTTGHKDVNMELEVISKNNQAFTGYPINITGAPMFNLNLGAQYQFYSKSGNRSFIEFGYSVPVAGGDVTFNDSSILKLSNLSNDIINILKPGGLMLGYTYAWAF